MDPSTRAEAEARAAADAWLARLDAGDYDGAWTEAASLMRGQIDPATLSASLKSVRSMFGALRSRAFTSATYATTLPGAPDGEYVVLTTKATFDQKSEAIETITPMRESDGTWRVSGYFIR